VKKAMVNLKYLQILKRAGTVRVTFPDGINDVLRPQDFKLVCELALEGLAFRKDAEKCAILLKWMLPPPQCAKVLKWMSPPLPCRLCRADQSNLSRGQKQVHKGICAREARKVGYNKS